MGILSSLLGSISWYQEFYFDHGVGIRLVTIGHSLSPIWIILSLSLWKGSSLCCLTTGLAATKKKHQELSELWKGVGDANIPYNSYNINFWVCA